MEAEARLAWASFPYFNYDGNVFEIIAWNSELSASNRSTVRRQLASKYRIPVS